MKKLKPTRNINKKDFEKNTGDPCGCFSLKALSAKWSRVFNTKIIS